MQFSESESQNSRQSAVTICTDFFVTFTQSIQNIVHTSFQTSFQTNRLDMQNED